MVVDVVPWYEQGENLQIQDLSLKQKSFMWIVMINKSLHLQEDLLTCYWLILYSCHLVEHCSEHCLQTTSDCLIVVVATLHPIKHYNFLNKVQRCTKNYNPRPILYIPSHISLFSTNRSEYRRTRWKTQSASSPWQSYGRISKYRRVPWPQTRMLQKQILVISHTLVKSTSKICQVIYVYGEVVADFRQGHQQRRPLHKTYGWLSTKPTPSSTICGFSCYQYIIGLTFSGFSCYHGYPNLLHKHPFSHRFYNV